MRFFELAPRGPRGISAPGACCLLLAFLCLGLGGVAGAEDAVADAAAAAAPATPAAEPPADTLEALRADTDILWICLAAFLVFFMQAGFALVETGFTRAKNACNIIMKNLMDFGIGSLGFYLIGFGLMFGTSSSGWFGGDQFMFDPAVASADAVNKGWAFFIFQTVFCATAATIISGAVAERTKFSAYLVYSILVTAVVYPIFGGWAWGTLWSTGGNHAWLANKGFLDFAGSTVVHSIGGWAALAGAIVVGPRIGKYVGGKPQAIPGHSLPLAALGVFILWLGWFGFNPGSTTSVGKGTLAYIAVTTNMAAAAGAIGGMIASWLLFKKPDVSFALNGALAGLVGITAGCDCIPVPQSIIVGLAAGVLVVLSVIFIDRLGIDDPVGAVSVHGVCGAFGTLCVGLFHRELGLLNGGGMGQTMTQLLGIGVGFAWSFGVSFALFMAIKSVMGMRVSPQEEFDGLDMHEHGMLAYPPAWIATSDTSKGG
jgi:Amt family ammonium transporter